MRILLVTSRWPWPPRRGDQLRAVQLLAALGAEHEVTLLAPEAPEGGRAGGEEEEAGKAVGGEAGGTVRVVTYRRSPGAVVGGVLRAAVGGLPVQTVPFSQPDLGRKLRRLAPAVDLVVLQLVRLAPHLGDVAADVPLAVDLIDSLSLNAATRARFDRGWWRPPLAIEARRLARWERRLIERSRFALVVSGRDREALIERLALPPALAARLAVVPVGLAGTRTENEVSAAVRRSPPVLAFTGNLGYFPNADAVTWFLRSIWPELAPLRERHPELRLVVAGDRPPGRVRRAVAAAGPGVELVASPPDLRSLLAPATIALAPLRCGSGAPIKVLEAWAAGVPVVASPWAAAGTTGKSGEDFLVAAGPEGWCPALESLLEAPEAAERRARLAAAGRARLAADYDPESLAGRLRELAAAAAAAPSGAS